MSNPSTNTVRSLTHDLCQYATGVVVPDNEPFFARLREELPLSIRRYASGSSFNGWRIPESWHVLRATVHKDGELVFDGTEHALGVAALSKTFKGALSWGELDQHLVTNPDLPDAYVYHCMWQYRPWDADWALCIPYETYKELGPGEYVVDIETVREPGDMLVAEYELHGSSERTLVFNAHTCHPHMANDDFAGVAVLVRLFQWLADQDTYYTYRLVLGPEHLGTVFYLHEREDGELERLVAGAFAEMPGTSGPIKVASTFPGNQPVDRAFRNAARHHASSFEFVPWRKGAGNDETVWEAPGYEVPFVEVSRCEDLLRPFREYHTSLDTADLMSEAQLEEFLNVFKHAVLALEKNARIYRRFDGLICLSNPVYDLYMERPDPAVQKRLAADSEKWGYLLDNLLRYFDGSLTTLEMAEKHDLPFESVDRYIRAYRDKDLVDIEFSPIERVPITERRGEGAA